ncbi:MAG TPA: FAD-dependent oxidoreductase [Candidatus Acidoferrales bacterium]|nr:FAD-dependent oxidoreductase [Candidatus Acidoferrales bacterium]
MESYDIVIVGGGMAGLAAALYAGWLGRSTLLLEREIVGGQIINAGRIENFPGFPEGVSGADLVARARTQALRFGAKTVYREVTGIEQAGKNWLVRAADAGYQAKAVIVASGGRRRALGVRGEREFEGKGVSHCATCDGALYAGRPVAVVGGGDTSLDEALFLTAFASEVTVVHRGESLEASATLARRAEADSKIVLLPASAVEEITGDSVVEAVRVRNLKTGADSLLPAGGVFICVGFEADTRFLSGVVRLDPQGHVEVDLSMQSSAPGIFAAGYARQKTAGQLASAAGDGVTAAVAAHRYLQARF